jgi:hypothetical protein
LKYDDRVTVVKKTIIEKHRCSPATNPAMEEARLAERRRKMTLKEHPRFPIIEIDNWIITSKFF